VIPIKKPTQAPAILRTRGVTATRELCERRDADPRSFKRTSIDFDNRIYGAESVKNALKKAQHDKCAFCESLVTPIAYGDVEHFRPKAAYRQNSKGPLTRPGYYWIAYEWSNLLFCCQLCNQRFKRNHFPLADASRRARSRHHNIEDEQPRLIHPALEDPASFLEFKGEYLRPIDGNPRGHATIEALGLNREKLAEKRRDVLRLIKDLIDRRKLFAILVSKDPSPDNVTSLESIDERLIWYVKKYDSDSAEYAAMVQATLREHSQS
jgi:uncharacterized protein (TIGR02646 family)